MDGWDEYFCTCGPKESVYLGHCAPDSEESSNGEEGNAPHGQPQLLNRGLVLQQVIQLWVMNLSFPFIRAKHYHGLTFSVALSLSVSQVVSKT